MKKELLSVIVPIYNVEMYLRKCIDSIIKQKYTELEIVLVDDGSTDLSGKICDEYKEKDKRIRVIHKDNGGLISARWTGVNEASGAYVTFVDSDDWIDEAMYDRLMYRMVEEKADVVTCGCVRYRDKDDWNIDVDTSITEGVYEKQQLVDCIQSIMLWNPVTNNRALDPSLCMKIFKKDILLDVMRKMKDYTFYYGEDTAVLYPYILKCEKACITHEHFYFHRRISGKVPTYFLQNNFFEDLFELYKYMKEEFEQYPNKEQLIGQLEHFYINSVNLRKKKYGDDVSVERKFLFPFGKVDRGSKIVIYGAGRMGTEYCSQVEESDYCKVVLWVDKNYENMSHKNVQSPEKITATEYDYIIIANIRDDVKRIIKNWLVEKGVDESKIILS